MLLGGVSLASLALIVFFGQAAKRVLPAAQTTISQQQSAESAAFRLALQPLEARRENLLQLVASDDDHARYLLATDLLSQGQATEALALLDEQATSKTQTLLAPYVLLKQGQAQRLAGETPTGWEQLLADHATHSAAAAARYALGKQAPAQWEPLLENHPSHPRAVKVALDQLKTAASKDKLLLVAAHGLYREEYEASLDRLVENYGS